MEEEDKVKWVRKEFADFEELITMNKEYVLNSRYRICQPEVFEAELENMYKEN